MKWQMLFGKKLKNELILPFLDIKLITFDLGIINRDKTSDKVTLLRLLKQLINIKLELSVQL